MDKWVDHHHTLTKKEAFNVIYGGGGLIKFLILKKKINFQ
jgi:hypothetical protein